MGNGPCGKTSPNKTGGRGGKRFNNDPRKRANGGREQNEIVVATMDLYMVR